MKMTALILCLMAAAPIHPTAAAEADNITNHIPSSTERTWTIDGRPYRELLYYGTIEKDGVKHAFFVHNVLGSPRTIPLHMLSAEDIEVIKLYDQILESKKNKQKTQQGGPGYPPQGVGSPDP